MKEFKVGDRVCAYDGHAIFRGRIIISTNKQISIKDENDVALCFHPKQCRRLVKKKRREIFVLFREGDVVIESVTTKHREVSLGWHRFVESRKK